MLYTCGLTNVGDACNDGEFHPIHGTIGNRAATVTRAETELRSGRVVVCGTARETRLYGRDLSLKRTVTVDAASPTVEIQDVVENRAESAEAIMLLYHINIGYPLLDDGTWMVTNADQYSQVVQETRSNGTRRYSSGPADAVVIVFSPQLQMGMAISWDRSRLPYLYRWRNLEFGDWVVGLEPATCSTLGGRLEEAATGEMLTLAPHQTASFGIRLTAFGDEKEMHEFAVSHEIGLEQRELLVQGSE